MEKKLEVNNLIISFRTQGGKVQAVRNISFDLYKGETLAIVGESGSGKSVTNRAILGILAGNSIVESGEIIYDGQDLLKISEEEFCKIRGDKIAMIFQDPLSSLNPIIKIGKQLTEAMLLKSKSSQHEAKRLFNKKLALLNAFMDETALSQDIKNHNKEQCKIFDDFCINGTKLESHYNGIYRAAVELQLEIDDKLFLLSKKQNVDCKKFVNGVLKRLPNTLHPDIVVMNETLQGHIDALTSYVAESGQLKALSDSATAALQGISSILDVAIKRPKPNYFTLGYYMMRNPQANVDDMPLDELTAMTRKYLDDEFMTGFIAEGTKAVQLSHDKSIELKTELLSATEETLEYFRGDFDRKNAYAIVKDLIKKVSAAIDKLKVVKNSTEYVFNSSILNALNKYFEGIRKNPKEQKRYEKQQAKYDRLIDKGKTPDWKPVPAALVDLELAKKNIRTVIHNLRAVYRAEIEAENTYDSKTEMVALIDYFKEQASTVVYKVTKKMAKARALKLMEEVGIPEPAIRYNQYPFEFSGGMRQRIVIAIALAANPDILICDEPTTALDVTIQSQILELINRIKAERNLSVIFITHDLGVVANMADRIAVMYAGKIVEYGTADDVFYDPRHPYTWALLSSMPDLDTKEKLEAIPGTPPNMIFPPKGDAFAPRNKYALEIDFEEEPPMFQISETHYAATWLLHPNAPKVAPPKIVTDRIERMSKKEVKKDG